MCEASIYICVIWVPILFYAEKKNICVKNGIMMIINASNKT